jgi:hypothetical protein
MKINTFSLVAPSHSVSTGQGGEMKGGVAAGVFPEEQDSRQLKQAPAAWRVPLEGDRAWKRIKSVQGPLFSLFSLGTQNLS